MRWLFSPPSPDRSQIKKDELEKLFIRTNVDPVFPVEVTSSSTQRRKNAPTCKSKEAISLSLLLMFICLQGRPEPASQMGMMESGGWETLERGRKHKVLKGNFKELSVFPFT